MSKKVSELSQEGDSRADEFLVDLGAHVRAVRAQRGMTRKILARDSDVSERYLAKLETGQGNVSILILRQIADAMDMNLIDIHQRSGTNLRVLNMWPRLAEFP